MLIIPKERTKEGLISLYNIKGKTFASSTNQNNSRKDNPILPNSPDRWCSQLIDDKYNEESWEVRLNHMIYITNYTFVNQNNNHAVPVSWKFEGYSPKIKDWELLHVVNKSNIQVNDFDTFETLHNGPYNSFKFTSIELGMELLTYLYSFCIYKVDFFGAAFPLIENTHNYDSSNYNTLISLFLLSPSS